jgi:hypothetical protein
MNNKSEKTSRKIADSSGFPLQIGIAKIANLNPNWTVLFDQFEEHPWSSPATQSEGFIDIVIQERNYAIQQMVIECKRVRDTEWVFLIPNPSPEKGLHARIWWSRYDHFKKWLNFGWEDFSVSPESYESRFCAILGQEAGRRTLLERTASELVTSIEALADQEKKITINCVREKSSESAAHYFNRVYIPVIVTTAELRVALFKPGSIALADGSLPPDASFETVPYIRFRKSLSGIESVNHLSLQEVHKAIERTVFVVSAESFDAFLGSWDITHGKD